MQKRCELCLREPVQTTVHHLIPKEMGGAHLDTAHLCIPCHKQIHALYSNKELQHSLFTLEALRKDERMAAYLAWIKKQPATKLVATKKRKR
ncbi:hypothetical protein A374_04114 [Fictibacillus macauensis ZFHKF-1]|uniref:HNH endonuclease n=1 Tax=Fictibacillus macauensis ZFHKF-1 TaxID=1196324 RepID=I8ALF1_9BACL|nr:HNH endonuclease [Fictibacillus macauensis]EIT86727.1 hypothetical protein A374_04114 [Fictibacillus macauensis ZFHKF-1]